MEQLILNILDKYNVKIETFKNTNNPYLDLPIYIINLESDIYRRAYIKNLMKKNEINYKMVIVKNVQQRIVDIINNNNNSNKKIKNGVIGCCLSHLWCIQQCIKQKYPHFLIFEDDIVFHKQFKTLVKNINYKKYDLLQLGCCDFNLKKNLIDKSVTVYEPKILALGAYGNIYNIHFAQLFFKEKINFFSEFDTTLEMYYDKYKIGICYPNLITTELSTTNINHNYSLFTSINKNDYFTKACFYEFDYTDYQFMWIIFIEYIYNLYKENTDNLDNYNNLVKSFSKMYKKNQNKINDILLNNNYSIIDLNEIVVYLETSE